MRLLAKQKQSRQIEAHLVKATQSFGDDEVEYILTRYIIEAAKQLHAVSDKKGVTDALDLAAWDTLGVYR